MDIVQLYQDHNVDFMTEGHPHCRPGCVNTHCPFCPGAQNYHLGFNLENDYFVCWRCGHHHTNDTVALLCNVTATQARVLMKEYGEVTKALREPKITIRRKAHKLPSGIIPLTNKQKNYLSGRGFDPDKLIRDWGLVGNGPVSTLSTGSGKNKKVISYKHRILAPIMWDGKQVSFQTRLAREAATKEPKYLTCPQDRELIDHKHILYGKQSEWGEIGICVEGITDVWRFGFNAVATFGIKFTSFQMRLIAKTFKRFIVIYDDEPQAILQADKLVAELKFRGVDAWRVSVGGDPGGMEQSEADYLVKQLIK